MDCLYALTAELKITVLIVCHDKELVREYAQDNSFVMQWINDEKIVIEQD